MYREIAANKRKTVVIMLAFMLLVGGLAWVFSEYMGGSPNITYGVIVGALIYSFISYFAGSRLSLAVNGAKPIQKKDNPRYYRIVENLAITEGIPTPKVYIMEDPAPNAFATGRKPSLGVVCATTGLLEMMEDDELEGVMAHELGHIKNYDIRVSMIAFALVAAVGLIADIILRMSWFRDDDEAPGGQWFFVVGLVAAIIAPIIATLIQLAISRKREYLADATGALTTRYPEGLARALAKIGKSGSTLKRQNATTAHFFFANPLKGQSLASLFSTHPPIEDRIKRLHDMGKRA